MAAPPHTETSPARHAPQPALAGAATFSGAALVASLAFDVSLGLTLALTGVTGALLLGVKWSVSKPSTRASVRASVVTGVIAGLVSTAAYDVTRLALVEFGRLALWPFETFRLFGALILGVDPSASSALVVGTAYHFLNGVAFAIAYCFLLGGRRWWYGVLWALGLEAAMLALYPGWLDLEPVMAEFVTMSFLGHVAYGAVLGVIAQRRLGPRTPVKDRTPVGDST